MNTGILTSILLLIISILFYLFPPKKINNLYGYRTMKSMSSIENWRVSNKYSSKGLLIISIINLIIFYLLSIFVGNVDKYTYLIILIFEFAVLFYLTEKKINQ